MIMSTIAVIIERATAATGSVSVGVSEYGLFVYSEIRSAMMAVGPRVMSFEVPRKVYRKEPINEEYRVVLRKRVIILPRQYLVSFGHLPSAGRQILKISSFHPKISQTNQVSAKKASSSE